MLHLTAGGVSFVLGEDSRGVPAVLHWGAALPTDAVIELQSTASMARLQSGLGDRLGPTIAASGADLWSGTPAFEWHADGVLPGAFAARVQSADDHHAVIELTEQRTGGKVALSYRLHPSGVLEATAELENTGTATIDLHALRLLIPIPDRGCELLDFTGAWSDERRPQRRPLTDGSWRRVNRRGRTGHDSVTLSCLGTSGFRYRDGEIWAVHLGWSGDGEVLVDRLAEGAGVNGAVAGAGELLIPGEVRLAPGDCYRSPSVFFVWSDAGLDGVAGRLHTYVRTLPSYPKSPRPLLLNSWEAVYFDHDLDRLRGLAASAAEVGVERFVLDDGWFLGRRDDTAGLGDWSVDPSVWPDGLRPLSDVVHGLGMEFGLWFEPEMVNPDSELARQHPEWVLADPTGAGSLWRFQQVLNIGNPECWQHVFDQVAAVVAEARVDYIKWDHNRDLHEAVDRQTGRAGVHEQTAGFYRMLAALRQRFPELEIESCASGGGRVDLGVLQHTQRVWASDTIDPLERQRIQAGTELLIPLELMGAHVGADLAHTTHRTTSLPFRMATALFGHAGIELDLTARSDEDRRAVAAWAALYREQRALLHSGDLVHGDIVPAGAQLRGVVSRDRSRALFQLAQLETARRAANPRTPLPGLDPTRRYRIRLREEFGAAVRRSEADPAWLAQTGEDGVEVAGALLVTDGVPLPTLQPAEALVIEVSAV